MRYNNHLLLIIFYIFVDSAVLAKRQKKDKAKINFYEKTTHKTKVKTKRIDPLFFVSGLTERKLISKLDEAVKKIDEIYKTTSSGRIKEKLLVKKLNIFYEKAIYISVEEGKAFEIDWDAWEKSGKKGKEPSLSNINSKNEWLKVEKTARSFENRFKNSLNLATVIFRKALAQRYLGKVETSKNSLLSIVGNHKKTKVYKKASFFLGEYYFDKNDFGRSKRYYLSSEDKDDLYRFGWSLFKIAWCDFNLGKYKRALSTWKSAIELSLKFESKKRAKMLKEQVLNDMIKAYVELGETKEAIEYYKKQKGDEYIPAFLRALASAYYKEGKNQKSLEIWNKIKGEYSTSEGSFEAQVHIIKLFSDSGNLQKVLEELKNLYKNYSPGGAWAKKQSDIEVDRARLKIEELLLYYPKKIHKLADKRNNAALFDKAKKGYKLFLSKYPHSKWRIEIIEYLGDIEYFTNKFEASGDYYKEIVVVGKNEAVVLDLKGEIKKNIFNRSVKNMLGSYEKAYLPELKKMIKTKVDFKKEATPLPKSANNYFYSCNIYKTVFSKDLKTQKICDVRLAEAYYRSGHKETAIEKFILLAENYSKSREGRAAINQLIPILKDDRDRLTVLVTKFLKNPNYSKNKIGQQLRKLIRGFEIEKIKNVSDVNERAKLYEKKAISNPKDKDADKFIFNAAIDFLAAKQIRKAMTNYELIVKQYPKSSVYKKALLQLAMLYDKALESKSAILYFKRFVKKYPKNKQNNSLSERICRLEIADNYKTSWESSCKKFAMKYKDVGMGIVEIIIDAAYLDRNPNILKNMIDKYYLKYYKITKNKRIIALIKKYALTSNKSSRTKLRNKILKSGKIGLFGEAKRYFAEFTVLKLDNDRRSLNKLRLKGGSVEKLQTSIQNINTKLGKLEKNYQRKVLSLKEPSSGVMVYFRLAEAYQVFSKKLANPPFIKGFKIEEIKKQLSGTVGQLLKKSQDYIAAGLKTAKGFKILNKSTIALSNLNFEQNQQGLSFSDFISVSKQVEVFAPDEFNSVIKP